MAEPFKKLANPEVVVPSTGTGTGGSSGVAVSKSTQIFDKASAGVLPGSSAGDSSAVAVLKVGGVERNFIMFGAIQSRQTDRVQVDAAADGSMHVLMCRGSVGTCSVSLLDRSIIQGCSGSTARSSSDFALKCYASELNSYKNRKATLSIYSEDNEFIAEFSGIIRGVEVSIRYIQQQYVPLTTLYLLGSWDA